MDYIEVINHFIKPIVNDFDKVEVKELPSKSNKSHVFLIRCSDDDIGRLIGRHGTTANALREVVSIAAKNNNEYVHLKIASISDNVDEENVVELDEEKEDN